MKYALIGCGRIAVNHMRAAEKNHLDVVALCDIDMQATESLQKEIGWAKPLKTYTDYKQMLAENPDIDLVAVATSSGAHAEIVLYCIGKGIPVIVEKPMALNTADAEEIVRASRESGVKVAVCHQNRFNEAVQEMRKALDAGRFGPISHGAVSVRWRREKPYYDQAAWRGKWASDGGCLFNQCIHGIDLLCWMMGPVEEVYGVTCRQFHDYMQCEDVGMAVVKFKNGTVGTIEGTVNVFPKNLEETLYLFGETGTVKIGGTSTNNIDVWEFSEETEDDERCRQVQEKTPNYYGNGHIRLYADMLEAIAEDRAPYVDAAAGRNAVEAVLAIYQSAFTGKPVSFPLQNVSATDFEGKFQTKSGG